MQFKYENEVVIGYSDNRVIFLPRSFYDLTYNCGQCDGLCCNINGSLVFSKSNFDKVNTNDKFNGFYRIIGSNVYLKTPKRCWFLSKNACQLKNDKPLFCSFYPYKVLNLSDHLSLIYIDICPQMDFYRKNNIESNEVIKQAKYMISKGFVNQSKNFTNDIIHQSLETEIISFINSYSLSSSIIIRDHFILNHIDKAVILRCILIESNISDLKNIDLVDLFSNYLQFKKVLFDYDTIHRNENLMNQSILLHRRLSNYLTNVKKMKNEYF